MKTKLLTGFAALATLSTITVLCLIKSTEYKGTGFTHETGEKENEKGELLTGFIQDRMRYEFQMIRNPITGKIPAGIFEKEMSFARRIPERIHSYGSANFRLDALNTYIPAGPDNMGGRTRAVEYDKRYNGTSNKVIIAGCVSGGIMRSADGGATWTLVTPTNDVHSFTALAQDPRPGSQDTWYAGGGEPLGNSAGDEVGAPYLGYGIWKSTDNGLTWTKLPLNTIIDFNGSLIAPGTLEGFDNPFDYVHTIKVNPVNGDLYICGHRRLIRSQDGGNTFRVVFGSSVPATGEAGQMDVAISNAGTVYLAVNGGNPDLSLRGVWVSPSGDQNTFQRVAGGKTPGVDSLPGWRGNAYDADASGTYSSRRILITLAPSNQNIGYVFYQNGLSSDSSHPEADFWKVNIAGSSYTWTNRSANMPDFPNGNASGSDPLTVQGGYDMFVKIYPTDTNAVFIGGTNLYRSTDAFATTANTAWIGGYQTNFTYATIANSHADMHNLAFNPTSPTEAICANDGGIQRSNNILASSVVWTMIPNYQTLQYYYVAIDPGSDRNNFAGGAQDNGVTYRDVLGIANTNKADSNNHFHPVGGDGSSVGISLLNPNLQTQYLYGGSNYGTAYRVPIIGNTSPADIKPNNLTTSEPGQNSEFGELVTIFRLDPLNTEDMYYVNFNRLFRTTSASSVTGGGWTELTGVAAATDPANPTGGRNVGIRALAFTWGPYNTSHVLYLGTTSGKIFRLNDPRNAAATTAPVNITPAGLIGNVQDIAVNPNNDNEIMAVVSNYSDANTTVHHIWWTNNAKSATPTWQIAEGNLALPSARSCAIVATKDANNNPVTEYYVGTSVGLYSAQNIGTTVSSGGQPTWQHEGGRTLNYAVVESLSYRPVDNTLLVGTHGNGMYYTITGPANFTPTVPTAINPVTNDRNFIRAAFPTVSTGTVQYSIGNLIGIRKIWVQLTDMKGSTVYQQEALYQDGSVSLQNLAAGTYILSINSDDQRYRFVQRIIKR